MINDKNLRKMISLIVIVAFAFYFHSDILLFAQEEDELLKLFENARNAYVNGQYVDAQDKIEVVIGYILDEKKELEKKDVLGQCYILLGAIHEKQGREKLARKNYQKAKEVKSIPGIDFKELSLFKEIFNKGVIVGPEKKPKKFPSLLVAGGVLILSVVLAIILKKKKYTLTVILGEGVDGMPTSGSTTYRKGSVVSYNYSRQSGYTNLVVTLDGTPVASSGTVTMDGNHTLRATTTELISLHIESNPSGAEVYVDGMSMEISTPCDFYISAGDHEIRLVRDDFGEAKRDINFEENLNYNLNVNLAGYSYEFETKWGGPGKDNGQFDWPRGIAVDKNNYVYVADSNNNRIQKFDSNGTFIAKWGSKGLRVGKFRDPSGIAVDENNNLFVVDSGNCRIQKFDSSGTFIGSWGSCGSGSGEFAYSWPKCIAIDKNNNVYVDEYQDNRVQKFDSNGTFIAEWGSHGSDSGQFIGAVGIAVNGNNDIYVCDNGNHRVQKFDSNGIFITEWGSHGSDNGQFSGTEDIAVDKNNYLYVSTNHWIQKFDSNGTFITKWGSYGSGNGQFSNPDYLAVDENGTVFTSEWDNNRIQKFRMSNTTEGDGEWQVNTTQGNTASFDTYNRFSSFKTKLQNQTAQGKRKKRKKTTKGKGVIEH
jgi:streptogramin lyase